MSSDMGVGLSEKSMKDEVSHRIDQGKKVGGAEVSVETKNFIHGGSVPEYSSTSKPIWA